MRRDALKAAALAALLAFAAAAAERTVKTTGSHTFADKTESKRYDLPAPGGGGRVRLRLRGEVAAGEIRFRVLDSEGNERQNARLTPDGSRPGHFDLETGEQGSAGGAWALEVELRGATGGYEFTWTVE
jgi:hypothetical protein